MVGSPLLSVSSSLRLCVAAQDGSAGCSICQLQNQHRLVRGEQNTTQIPTFDLFRHLVSRLENPAPAKDKISFHRLLNPKSIENNNGFETTGVLVVNVGGWWVFQKFASFLFGGMFVVCGGPRRTKTPAFITRLLLTPLCAGRC